MALVQDVQWKGSMMTRETYRDPIFNLKAVVEATGVTADALRAWERRYGLPQPARTEADHRIYSRRDIDIVKWLVARQEEGLRIGRAVELWRSLEEEGQDPLRRMPLPSESAAMPAGNKTVDLRDQWISACLAFDDRRADRILTQSFGLFPPEVVVLEIIQEGIAEIGRMWYRGEATVQQEHFASRLAMRRLETLIMSAPSPTRRGRILIACPAEEEHVIGPSVLALLLRRAGWDVVYLGADVPLMQMERTVDDTNPDLVILAAQQLHTAANLLEMAELLQREGVSTAFGGGIFNRLTSLRSRVPGHFLGQTLNEAVEETERLIVRTTEPPSAERLPDRYKEALSHYNDRRLKVEAQVLQSLGKTDVDARVLHEVTTGFADALQAALRFGDMDLLTDHIDWVERRDGRKPVWIKAVQDVIESYREATIDQLDDRGALVMDWFNEEVSEEQ
jgi:methanogenic corrinoid protein MtbC1